MSDLAEQLLVDRLPAEILAHVLVLHAANAFEIWTKGRHSTQLLPDYLYVPWMGNNPYASLDVTRVCRKWRTVALSCPGFWSNIVVGPRRNVKLLLERSRDHSLDVFCLASNVTGCRTRHNVLRLTLEHLHRIRSLQLVVRAKDAGMEPRILYQPATARLLESLSVYFADNAPENTNNSIRAIGAKWTSPRLRWFKMYGGNDRAITLGNFAPLQFKNTLTHLVWLPTGSAQSQTPFSCTEDVLSVLRSLPHLETLHIGFAKDLRDDRPVSRSAHVQLPHLRRLLLEGHVDICVGILEHLEFPEPLQQFGVFARCGSRQRDDVVQLTDFLSDLIQPQDHPSPDIPPRQLLTLCIRPDTQEGSGVQVMAWQGLHPPTRFPTPAIMHDYLSRTEYEDMDLCFSLPQELPRRFFERFFKGVRFDTVQSLQLGVAQCRGEALMPLRPQWANVAARLKAVKTLAFTDQVDPQMLSLYLSSTLDEGAGQRYHFRALRQLFVSGLDVEGRRVNDFGPCESTVLRGSFHPH